MLQAMNRAADIRANLFRLNLWKLKIGNHAKLKEKWLQSHRCARIYDLFPLVVTKVLSV